MKIVLNRLMLSISLLISCTCAIHAEQTEYVFDDNAINNAVIAGDGSEDNPYILDYSQVPEFEAFIQDIYNNASHSQYARTYYTSSCLTLYKGIYTDGGVWSYSSGGMSVSSDGSLRFVRIAYIPVDDADDYYHKVYSNSTVRSLICTAIGYIAGSKTKAAIKSAVANTLISNGYSSVSGVSASKIGEMVAMLAGATAVLTANSSLIQAIINDISYPGLSSAADNNKTFVNISFMTSYHGSWYSYTTSECGWSDNEIYVPASFYGTGSLQ